MFGIGSADDKKKSVFGEKRRNIYLDAFGKSGKVSEFGTFRKNLRTGAEKQPEEKSLYDVLKEKPEGYSVKTEPEDDSLYDNLDDVRKGKNSDDDKDFHWSIRIRFTGECLFPVLLVGTFILVSSWLSDSNEAEIESRRAKLAQNEIAVNARVLKSIEAKNPKEPLPNTLELVAATELGKNTVVITDPWGKPYVYDRKNRLLRCVVKNPDGSVKYEIARRF